MTVLKNDHMARDRSNRFNAKGRQSGLNKLKEDYKRKERKKAGISQDAGDSDGDANTDIIVPKTKEQKEIDKERKLEMRKQVCRYHYTSLSNDISLNLSKKAKYRARSARDWMHLSSVLSIYRPFTLMQHTDTPTQKGRTERID